MYLRGAQDANLKNAVVNEAYILGSTKLDGINIEGADFSDTFLRKDQQRFVPLVCHSRSGKGVVGRQEEEGEEEEEEEEEGLLKANAVNEEDPERDRATQV